MELFLLGMIGILLAVMAYDEGYKDGCNDVHDEYKQAMKESLDKIREENSAMHLTQDEVIIVLQLRKRMLELLEETTESEENKDLLALLRDAEESLGHIFE